MWLLLAFLSATLLGFYDVFKKQSLKDNACLLYTSDAADD